MTIIVTGFGPFLSHSQNPTIEVLKRLPKTLNGHSIIPVELPVEYDTCFSHLEPFIETLKPHAIVLLGLAAKSQTIRLERFAMNLKDSQHPDTAGQECRDQVILPNGPLAYSSTLPLREFERELTKYDIPVSISNSAGLYVCNNLFYHTMHYINNKDLAYQAGFIHVPETEPTTTAPMSLATIVDAVIRILQILSNQKE